MLVTSNCLTHMPFAVIDQTDRINGRRVGGGISFATSNNKWPDLTFLIVVTDVDHFCTDS